MPGRISALARPALVLEQGHDGMIWCRQFGREKRDPGVPVGAENACYLGVCAEEAVGSVPARGGW